MELFNAAQPAVETRCDSCSLLKICTRELFLLVLSVSASSSIVIDGPGAEI